MNACLKLLKNTMRRWHSDRQVCQRWLGIMMKVGKQCLYIRHVLYLGETDDATAEQPGTTQAAKQKAPEAVADPWDYLEPFDLLNKTNS
jgi:hypothetical protein